MKRFFVKYNSTRTDISPYKKSRDAMNRVPNILIHFVETSLARLYFVLNHYKFDRYSSMALAAFLPAPMARITVAAPLAASPPANTPLREV